MPSFKIRYLLFANYLNLFAFAFFSPLYALFVTRLGAGPKIVGLSAGVGAYATALMILAIGRYENKFKNKEKLIVIGYFWLAAGAASFMLVTRIWELFAVQIFNAIGIGILSPSLKTVYAAREDKGQEAKQWSFWDGGNALFAATGALIGGFLLTALGGFKPLFALISLIQLGSAIVAINIIKKKKING